MTTCTVCDGQRRYPIANKGGRELYRITCPHCAGTGDEPPQPKAPEGPVRYAGSGGGRSPDAHRMVLFNPATGDVLDPVTHQPIPPLRTR